ncbi:hypothetical protein ZHAS_00011239 [Anopheles sinensis]|uniref:Uncharacterized protein n=1 Tax=Anopheles sinensis TaxID=74873 RepID=A0A084VZN3_ANOSI|nr:hypothetical protein ZHAS_00011239 [Anopheles sinensis]
MPEVGTMGGSMEMRKSATVVACLAILLLQLGTLLPRSAAQQTHWYSVVGSSERRCTLSAPAFGRLPGIRIVRQKCNDFDDDTIVSDSISDSASVKVETPGVFYTIVG